MTEVSNEQIEQEILAYEICDEALETAAGAVCG